MPEYYPDFIPPTAAVVMFRHLWDELQWERRGDAPRHEYWTNDFNRDYTYGRGAGQRTYKAQPMHSMIEDVKDLLIVGHDVYFEGCFLNGYEGSHDWLGWHADDDHGIDHSKPIAVVTLYEGVVSDEGAFDKPVSPDIAMTPRAIQFRQAEAINDSTNEIVWGNPTTQSLEQGSLCLMPAGFQQWNQHRIPKAGFNARKRISLTFRSLL